MAKKIVLYLGADLEELKAVGAMIAKTDISIRHIPRFVDESDINFREIQSNLDILYDYRDKVGVIVNLDLKSKYNDGLGFLKMCRKSSSSTLVRAPKLLIVDDEVKDLTERQMEEVRQFQFGLLYKPRFDGRHIAQLLAL